MSACARWIFSAVGLIALVACSRPEPPPTVVHEKPAPPEVVPADLGDDALAEWLIARSRYAEALPVVQRVVQARSSADAAPLPMGQALMSFGMVQDAVGESEAALTHLVEAWDLLQTANAAPALLGACADALGLSAQACGHYEEAEQAFRAAIEHRQTASPDADEPWVSASRVHLGKLYLTTARYPQAETLLRSALKSATDPAAVATRARALGSYHHTLGGYEKAVELFDRARAAAETQWGARSEQVAAILGDLGLAQLRAGDSQLAEKNLVASRAIIIGLGQDGTALERTSAENLAAFYLFDRQHEAAIGLLEGREDLVSLNNAGAALQMAGNFPAALSRFERAAEKAAADLDAHHPLRVQILQNLATTHWDAGDKAAALEGANLAGEAAMNLLGKLLVFGSESQKLEFRRGSDPLSLLCSFGAPPQEIADMLRRTKGVVLDSLLGGADAARGLESAESAHDCLVDYSLYQRYLGRGEWQPYYGACIQQSGEAPRWVELGSAKRLRSLIADLRAHMSATATGRKSQALLSIDAVLAELHRFCIEPLGDLPPSLAISPDGDLRFVPFAALRSSASFFCQSHPQVRFVPSARLAIETPDQGEGWSHCAVERYAGIEAKGAGELGAALAELGNLPGVAAERKVLRAQAEFTALPTAKTALLEELATGPAPKVLHFSCHGIFLGTGSRPMFRSGLVLENKEVLFAGEISALPLKGTELVTLAACDTGLGESVGGEGVIGLQRGFQLAGAQNILMSLWPVGDQELPELMSSLYARIAKGETAGNALWTIQSERLSKATTGTALAREIWTSAGYVVLGR